jgi:hypothetical protein
MEAVRCSETAITFHYTTKLNIPEDTNLHIRQHSVGVAAGYELDDRGFRIRVPIGSRIFSSPRRPHLLWGPPSLLFSGYRSSFPEGKAAGT